LSDCKLVVCGGEGYPLTLLEKLKKLGIPNIINTYGPTEITVSSNLAILTNADHISIGKPLPNYTEYIVDSDDNLVPQGVIGELLIGGLGVARGYHNLPETTAQKFVTFRGERIYKSGDYAKWDKDGNVLILGRKDNQVKLRGLRIELTEISELIEAQEGIKKAIVLIRKLAGQDNLCAYFTADRTIDINSLRDELSKKLTKYMVPTAYLQLESIPVTPNGKTDIKNLPEPPAVSTGEYVEPVGEVEKTFADIFARILKLEKVGATDNFFEIGGTSLIAASVVIQADQSGYEITFGDLFAHKTPRAIAKFLSDESDEEAETNAAANYTKYNHTAINEVLAKNTLDSFLHGEKQPIGNILLTGSTGYMGMHVLFTFLQNEDGTAYCLVRAKKGKDTAQRLDKLFLYYFGDIISSLPQGTFQKFRERIKVVEGDVTDTDSLERIKDLPFNTVFNCAANVKLFSSGTVIEDGNVGGVINCIRFCKASGARLIHFSTTSIAGTIKNTPENSKIILTEQNMFYGQELANQYTSSKMLAELEVMKAI
ncbi:MAG: AMP-binding protein, partial [Spirochaetales bacterium]|nr:AMP-binding protein [Spirochaetales bacterium]